MTNKYGLAAVLAVKKIKRGEFFDPRKAWESALSEYYDPNSSSFHKGCPRDTFLGLCEEGIIEGVSTGNYTRSIENKKYALRAIHELKKDASLSNDLVSLWEKACGHKDKVHNSQMNVVIELYKNGLIKF